MNLHAPTITTIACFAVAFGSAGCSTRAAFTIPNGAQLTVYNRPVEAKNGQAWVTRPFFWTAAGGVPYRLEKDGKVLDEGKLSSTFRPASIFWPPFALIYWPMGFRFDRYDLRDPDPARGVRSNAPSRTSR